MSAVEVTRASWIVDDAEILAETSFSVAEGTATALVGPNGSGKTTLLRMICGRLSPSRGSVTVFGRVPDDRDAGFRADLSELLGAPGYYGDLTLGDHLDFLGRLWDVADTHAELERLGALHLSTRYIDEMSSGQRQLAFLALALTRPSRLLVLDEPEQRLDAAYRVALGEILAARRDEGSAIVIATHDDALRDRIADHVVALEEGG